MKAKAFGFVQAQGFLDEMIPKNLRFPSVRRSAPVTIRIVTMAKFHKSGSFELFFWNCAATAAGINCFAVYSVDIIIGFFATLCKGIGGKFQAVHAVGEYIREKERKSISEKTY